jgi:hypothetical protein
MTASGILKADSESVSDHSQAEKALATGNKSSISVEDAAQKKRVKSMRKKLRTGSSELDRLLRLDKSAVSLEMLARAAGFSGKRLMLEIRDQHPVQIVQA